MFWLSDKQIRDICFFVSMILTAIFADSIVPEGAGTYAFILGYMIIFLSYIDETVQKTFFAGIIK